MGELNALYICKKCGYPTPRKLKYCFDCGVKLPDGEALKNAEDNNPQPDARRLPSTYKKFGEK